MHCKAPELSKIHQVIHQLCCVRLHHAALGVTREELGESNRSRNGRSMEVMGISTSLNQEPNIGVAFGNLW